MDRGEIITETLLMLGENDVYNDNKSDMYEICEKMLDSVISNIATSSAFLFNAITTKLTTVGQVDGENKFEDLLRLLEKKMIESASEVDSKNDDIKVSWWDFSNWSGSTATISIYAVEVV